MADAAKTYSFRAPSEFGKRLQRARRGFNDATRNAELSAHFGNEFELALLRRLRKLGDDIPAGVFIHAITESFVSTVERIEREDELMEEMRAFDREDTEGDAWRRGALRLMAARIATEDD
jgi:hypothetical protein